MPIEAYAGSNSAPRHDSDSNDEDEEDECEDRQYYYEDSHPERGGSYYEPSGGLYQEYSGGSYHEQSGGGSCREQSGGVSYRELSEGSDHEQSGGLYHGRESERPQWQQKAVHSKDIASLPRSREHGPGTYLMLDDGVEFEIPQYYDEFAPSLHLPPFSSLQIEEKVVYGRLKATAFFAVMDADPWTALWRTKYDLRESWGKGFDKGCKQKVLEKRKFGLQVSSSCRCGRICSHFLLANAYNVLS